MGEEFHYTDILEIAILIIMILFIIRFLQKRCQRKRAMAIRSTLLGSPKPPDQSLNNAFPMMQYPVPSAPSTVIALPQATLAPGQSLTSLEIDRQPKRQLELSQVYNSWFQRVEGDQPVQAVRSGHEHEHGLCTMISDLKNTGKQLKSNYKYKDQLARTILPQNNCMKIAKKMTIIMCFLNFYKILFIFYMLLGHDC